MGDKSLAGEFPGKLSGEAGEDQSQDAPPVASLKAVAEGSSNEAAESVKPAAPAVTRVRMAKQEFNRGPQGDKSAKYAKEYKKVARSSLLRGEVFALSLE